MKPNASTSCLIESAFDEAAVITGVSDCLDNLGANPDLVIAAVSSDYGRHLDELIELLQIYGHATNIVGGSASGLFGVGKSSENACGLSLVFLSLPRTEIFISTTGEGAIQKASSNETGSSHLLLSNPMAQSGQMPGIENLIKKYNTLAKKAPLVGGVISGGPDEDDLFLFTEAGKNKSPAIAIELKGGIRLVPVVSQSCKPIGDPLVVTEVDDNEVITIARRDAFSVLEETFAGLAWDERIQAEGNIFAGIAALESVGDFETGHFLIRPIIGADLVDGRLKLSSPARAGQTIQFQMRDPMIAEQDLRDSLKTVHFDHGNPFAGVLFGGKNRGAQLYGEEDRDAAVFLEELGEFPLTGFFTHREIGPVGDTTFSHEHSLCGALFYDE